MVGHERSMRAPRRRSEAPRSFSRAGQSELGWVAALLVVAVLVAIVSVGGPVWDVFVAGTGLLH